MTDTPIPESGFFQAVRRRLDTNRMLAMAALIIAAWGFGGFAGHLLSPG